MKIISEHETMERLFDQWRLFLEADYLSYRNHAYRVFNMACGLADADGDSVEKLAVAAAFHDISIWQDNTFDYLGPSIRRASAYLSVSGRESWSGEIALIIQQHHKLFPWRGAIPDLVEAFRRADWLDVCLFGLPTSLPHNYLVDLLRVFPRKGFHKRLVVLALRWMRQHPLRPFPMFRL
jgi:hypothetical protein